MSPKSRSLPVWLSWRFGATLVIASLMRIMTGPALAQPGVDPQIVNATVPAGTCITITKVVHTPPIPPKPDIVFLADNTGSMGAAIANVQANAAAILAAVDAADPESQFGVALYTDFNCTDPFPYLLQQSITANNADVLTAINNWAAGDGCDTPEAQLNALFELATTGAGYRAGSTKIIVWFGDASGHDPSGGHTLTDVINALVAAGIRVIAVPVDTGGAGDGLDSTGQATAITSATGGVLVASALPEDVSAAILAGLGNLPVAVSPQVGTCDPSLAVTFDIASQTVTSGTDATFQETICVAANASQCGSINCAVDWLLDGNPVTLPDGSADPAFVQSITVAVPDVTPPTILCPANITQCNDAGLCSAVVTFTVQASDNCGIASIVSSPASGSTFPKGTTTVTSTATDTSGNTATCTFTVTVNDCEAPVADCVPTTNVAGDTTPPPVNPDGFFQLLATDNCDATAGLQIFVKDSSAGPCGGTFAAGPYAPGTKVKLVNLGDHGKKASVKKMAGVITAIIQTIGDPVLVVTDSSGNQVCHLCLVPPPPK